MTAPLIYISTIEYDSDNRGLNETILTHKNIEIEVDPIELFLNAIENNCNERTFNKFETLINEVIKWVTYKH